MENLFWITRYLLQPPPPTTTATMTSRMTTRTRPTGQWCVLCVVHVALCAFASVQHCASLFVSVRLRGSPCKFDAIESVRDIRPHGAAGTHWVETVWNRQVQFKDVNLFPLSLGGCDWANEQKNERSGARKRSKQCGTSEWVSSASERASGGANGLRVDFMPFLPKVRRRLIGGGG